MCGQYRDQGEKGRVTNNKTFLSLEKFIHQSILEGLKRGCLLSEPSHHTVRKSRPHEEAEGEYSHQQPQPNSWPTAREVNKEELRFMIADMFYSQAFWDTARVPHCFTQLDIFRLQPAASSSLVTHSSLFLSSPQQPPLGTGPTAPFLSSSVQCSLQSQRCLCLSPRSPRQPPKVVGPFYAI